MSHTQAYESLPIIFADLTRSAVQGFSVQDILSPDRSLKHFLLIQATAEFGWLKQS